LHAQCVITSTVSYSPVLLTHYIQSWLLSDARIKIENVVFIHFILVKQSVITESYLCLENVKGAAGVFQENTGRVKDKYWLKNCKVVMWTTIIQSHWFALH